MTEMLHQKFYRSLFTPDPWLEGDARYKSEVAKYRRMMRDAEHFVLDKRSIETIMDKGLEIEFLMDRSQIAHLPFDTVWLEYDNHHKTLYSQRIGIAKREGLIQCPVQQGYLIKRIQGRPDAWVAFRVMDMGDEEGLPCHGLSPIAYLFDAGSLKPISMLGEYRAYTKAGFAPLVPIQELEDQYEKLKIVDHAIGHYIWGIKPNSEYDQFDEVSNIASICVEPIWELASELMMSESTASHWADLFAEALREHTGTMRFLVTALALINHVPIIYKPFEGKRGAFRTKQGIQPYFTHRTVSIDFARIGRKRITAMLQAAAKEARRRAHKVRRYYRSIRDAAGNVIGRKWIEAHTRGDPRLGWVHHDYEVTDSR